MRTSRLTRWARAAGLVTALVAGLCAPAAAEAGTGEVRFYYASARAYDSTLTANGATASFSVHEPIADRTGHSLAELALTSGDARQIVEVGWTVDRQLYGDTRPRVFVFHWIDGQPTCYNACGFVWRDASPGIALTPGKTNRFSIIHGSGRWSVFLGTRKIGYFPDTLWGGRFTKPEIMQVFGEVASTGPAYPCAEEMGAGIFPTASTGATISNVRFLPSTVPAVDLGIQAPTPDYYRIVKTSANSVRYGGPGAPIGRCL